MNENKLNQLSYDLYKLMTYIHDKLFDPFEIAKSSPLPLSYIKVIFYLFKAGSSPISKVASDLGISKSNMSPIVDRLLDEALIIRYNDDKDRRVHRIELSAEGLTFIEGEELRISQTISKKLSTIEDDDLESLRHLIDDTKEILQKTK